MNKEMVLLYEELFRKEVLQYNLLHPNCVNNYPSNEIYARAKVLQTFKLIYGEVGVDFYNQYNTATQK